jgi:hypothetical protein
VFCRYLIGRGPDRYVLGKYVDAHGRIPVLAGSGGDRFDRLLLAVARRSPWLARLADAYARVFCPAAPVRVKLVLLLAILECSALGQGEVEPPAASTPGGIVLRAGLAGLAFGVWLAVGTLLLGPAHLWLRRRRGPPARGTGPP